MTDRAYRQLICAIVLRAIADAQSGRACDEQCGGRYHHCAEAARAFLESEPDLLLALGLLPARLADILASPVKFKRPKTSKKKTRR